MLLCMQYGKWLYQYHFILTERIYKLQYMGNYEFFVSGIYYMVELVEVELLLLEMLDNKRNYNIYNIIVNLFVNYKIGSHKL